MPRWLVALAPLGGKANELHGCTSNQAEQRDCQDAASRHSDVHQLKREVERVLQVSTHPCLSYLREGAAGINAAMSLLAQQHSHVSQHHALPQAACALPRFPTPAPLPHFHTTHDNTNTKGEWGAEQLEC